MWSWILMILFSMVSGILITLLVQFYFFKSYFTPLDVHTKPISLPREPFRIPDILLQTLRANPESKTKEGCMALNLLFQFLFHELRDTEKIRNWFRNKLTIEFEELLTRTTVGKMFGSIKVRDISLGSEFPIIKSITVDEVKFNEEMSYIDMIDVKLDLSYKGGFRLLVDANMMLGKAAFLSVKVGELEGLGRLQFTRLPYSHWSFSFYNDPRLELDVESQFQGRPLHQITTLISNQIRKSIRKKHTLPNFKLRYKPFFTVGEDSLSSELVPPCLLSVRLLQLSRLHKSSHTAVYCLVGVDPLPWLDVVSYGKTGYLVLDVVVTKKGSLPLGVTFKQEFLSEQNRNVVMVESSSQPELWRGDVLISVDGRKVTQANQVPKLMKYAAIQATLRVERATDDARIIPLQPSTPMKCSLPEFVQTPATDADPVLSSKSGSPSRHSPLKEIRRMSKKMTSIKSTPVDSGTFTVTSRLLATRQLKNTQVISMDETLSLNVALGDRYLNVVVRGTDTSTDQLMGYVSLPLSKILRSPDYLHSCQLKPPDTYSASNSKGHELSGHNGFIPLLTYGDILLTAEVDGVSSEITVESPASPTAEVAPRPGSADKLETKHVFARTHLQSSTQCQFCGKKIWFKDAEKCQNCDMTCHKKCVGKCKTSTVCSLIKKGVNDGSDDSVNIRRSSGAPEIVMTSSDSPPPAKGNAQSGTRRGISSLLASVASAGRGLKRVGSAHNLQLPEDGSGGDGLSRSLPPSPQQSPSPSRKPSLPLDLCEEISDLLGTLLQQGADQGDMMYLAKTTGKSLYEDMDLPQRKEKIQEMMNKLKAAIADEASTRFALEKELNSKDLASNAKTAFLVGKSGEKTEALTVLMLHFCAGLQHIQDLEEQERDALAEGVEDSYID